MTHRAWITGMYALGDSCGDPRPSLLSSVLPRELFPYLAVSQGPPGLLVTGPQSSAQVSASLLRLRVRVFHQAFGQGVLGTAPGDGGGEQVLCCCLQISAGGSEKACQHQARLFMLQGAMPGATPGSSSNSNARATLQTLSANNARLVLRCDRRHQAEMLQA